MSLKKDIILIYPSEALITNFYLRKKHESKALIPFFLSGAQKSLACVSKEIQASPEIYGRCLYINNVFPDEYGRRVSIKSMIQFQ